MKLKIKKGALVEVITGSDKGKRGTVLFIDKDKLKVRVQGVRMQTHFDKKEGVKKLEGLIDYSNVKMIEQAPPFSKGGGKKDATKKIATGKAEKSAKK